MTTEPVAAMQVARLAKSLQPKLLMLTHAIGGGVARHLDELQQALQGRAHVLKISPDRDKLRLTIPGLGHGEYEIHVAFHWPDQQGLFWRFLAQMGVSQVHVHHVLNWPTEFWPVFLAKIKNFDLTLHDHCMFSIVKRSSAIGIEEQKWLGRVQRAFGGDVQQDARVLYRLATAATRVLIPSLNLHENVQRFFPELDTATLQHRPHLEAEQLQNGYPMPFLRPLMATEPLRILCLGMLNTEKGAQVLARVARESSKQNMPVEFHLLGSCHVHLPSCIIRHGSYLDSQVTELFTKINPHLLWLPAQCPETWSYTLSAGLRAGVPVVATHIGVFPERLCQRPLSWLCDPELSVLQWLGLLMSVRDRHFAASQQSGVWRYVKAEEFYIAKQGGYVSDQVAELCTKLEPLTDYQISQILVQGLPEAKRWRDHTLHLLLKLKYNAWLAPLVRIIPYAWQRKVKRLISRSPLSEPPAQ